MTNTDLINDLKTIIQPYVQDEEAFKTLTEKTSFIDDLKINSAHLVDVILDVEDKYDITIEDDEMDQMTNVASAISVIQKKLASA